MKKRNKMLIIASVVAAIGVAGVAVGTTVALFNRTTTKNVHIQAGNLDIGFYLTRLKYQQLNPEGEIVDVQVDLAHDSTYAQYYVTGKGVDLAQYTADPIVTIDNIFPSMGGEFTYAIYNNSDIAVNASIATTKSGVWGSGNPTKSGQAMEEADIAVLGVTSDWTSTEKIAKGSNKSAKHTFVLDSSAGNEYEGSSFKLTSVLTATQISAS